MDVLGLGTAAMDIVLQCDSLPKEDGFSFIHTEQLLPGGSCANILVTLANLGKSTAMVAAIGDDHYGIAFKKDLASSGVDPRFLKVRSWGTTLHTFITVEPQGSRAIYANLGDSLLNLSEEEVTPTMLDGIKVFYTDMFPGKPALKLARHCKQAGIPVVFNLECSPSFMNLCGISKDDISQMIGLCDLFMTGKDALTELTASDDFSEAAHLIDSQYKPAQGLVTTWGEEGAFWFHGEEKLKASIYQVHAIDTTGAGDAFAGGLIFSYFLQNNSPETALEFASGCAALKCTQLGARLRGGETEVRALMAQYR
jgi:sugar/nucleoside kinase (ribokinase family)